MKGLEAIKAKVLPKIQPTKEENQKLLQLFNLLKQNLQSFAEKLNVKPSFIQNHGSSGIKQTHLKGSSDLDIFIGLDPSNYVTLIEQPSKDRKKALKDLFLSYVKDWFIPATQAAGFSNHQLSYAEHPYLIITHEQYEMDIVGCFNLNYEHLLQNGPITAVDRTPWHSKIVAKRLNDNQKNDVRLLKKFLQNNFVYGDKKTLGRFGFTGFSAEVLMLHFKSIENIFTKLKTLKTSALDFFNRSTKGLRGIDRFKKDYLIIIDPVDKNRNVAASISKRAFSYACYQIERFFESPSVNYFIKEPIKTPNSQKLTQMLPHLVVAEFINEGTTHYTEIRDKLYSASEKLRKLLINESTGEERFGNTVFEVYFEEKTFVFVFYCEQNMITPTYLRRGPPQKRTANVKQFCIKHPEAFYKDGYYYVNIKRAYRQPLQLISEFFQNSKPINGLKISEISQNWSSQVGQKAVSLMLSCVLPLYGM